MSWQSPISPGTGGEGRHRRLARARCVARTIGELGHQYNAADLIASYIQWLETAAREAGQAREAYARVLQAAATAARALRERE